MAGHVALPRRRDVLASFATGAVGALVARAGFGGDGEFLPEPDFSRVQGQVAGIRPYRARSYRLELERLGEKRVVHNYGHGGGGLTVSFGCALEAVDRLQRHAKPPREVAVLGAGVLGLSTATVLKERGFEPVVYAVAFSPNTTSNVAGGQWAASLMAVGRSASERALFDRIQERSLEHFRAVLGTEFGVAERDNYVESFHDPSLLDIPTSLLPPARRLERLPFEHTPVRGGVRETLLIEPPIYLPRVEAELRGADVAFVTRELRSLDDVHALPETDLVNCLGAGAGPLFGDRLMVPIRGQLVLLEPQELPWLLSHRSGYIFPRRDAVVLGGTVERGRTEAVTDPASCARILSANRAFFRRG